MRALLPLTFLLSACALSAVPSSAQEKAADAKDPQSKFEPRSKPGEGQEFLKKFVGDWDVAKAFHPRSGDPVRQRGECRQAMIHDGRFLESDFTFFRGEAKTTGKGIIGFEVGTGLFTSVWTDSRSTGLSLRQSREKFDGKEIVLFGRPLAEGKKGRASRTVTRLEGGDRIVHRQYTPGDGGKERLVMELVLTRKAKGAK